MQPTNATDEWQALADHADQMTSTDLRTLFADDSDRGSRLTAQAGDAYLTSPRTC